MDARTLTYIALCLVFVGYPIYYLTTRPTDDKYRLLGLGLIFYGALLLYWPGLTRAFERLVQMEQPGALAPLYQFDAAVFVASLMIAFGFGMYFQLIQRCLLWIIAIAYGIMVLHWDTTSDPLAVIFACLLIVIAFEQCTRVLRVNGNHRP